MSPKKLTDATKTEILKLYRETEATTSTLADRYEVSSSTISRFLKSYLTETEYEDLIQQKRLARTPRRSSSDEDREDEPEKNPPSTVPEQLSLEIPRPKQIDLGLESDSETFSGKPINLYKINKQKPIKINRKAEDSPPAAIESDGEPEPTPKKEQRKQEFSSSTPLEPMDSPSGIRKKEILPDDDDEDLVSVSTLEEMFGEDIDDLDEEDEEEDWDDEEEEIDYRPESFTGSAQLQVLPLSAAAFPKTCYLVIDRFAELITRPLKDFAELGKIPPQEVQQRTLPVFDSHRVARRFSKRRERVIKVPDGQLLQKVQSHLEAKGITRLLIDGRIYTLSP